MEENYIASSLGLMENHKTHNFIFQIGYNNKPKWTNCTEASKILLKWIHKGF